MHPAETPSADVPAPAARHSDAAKAVAAGRRPAGHVRARGAPSRRRGPGVLLWGLHVGVVAVVLLGMVRLRAPDRRSAERAAAVELRARLDSGERVLQVARTLQRKWWNYFRATHGLLTATDRRVFFVGVSPSLLAGPRDPMVFESASFPYDASFTVRQGSVLFGRARGVVVATRGRADEFAVFRGDEPRLDALVRSAGREHALYLEALGREQRWRDSVAALPPVREYHVVRRGEALSRIAERYGVEVDQLRQLNSLESDRIKAGQRLLVRVSAPDVVPCPPTVCSRPSPPSQQ